MEINAYVRETTILTCPYSSPRCQRKDFFLIMLNETREVRKTMRHLRDIHGVKVATKPKLDEVFVQCYSPY